MAPKQLDPKFVGRTVNRALLDDLKYERSHGRPTLDLRGERGEFHVAAGPMFSAPLSTTRGEVVTRDGFVFCDVLLTK